ncbi:MAG: fibronectin type III domain-containing protein [Minisyncoccota bacterium]
MKKTLISFSVGLALLAGTALPASAATLTTSQVQAVISLLQAFGVASTTISNVQQTLTGAQTDTTTTTTASTTAISSSMIGFLRMGDMGDGVKLLQTILAADQSVYPEGLISGTFGPLTQKALERYQRKHGLAQVGFVGPKTLQDLDEDLNANPIATENGDQNANSDQNASSTISIGEGNGHFFCAIVPPGHLIAPGWLRHHGDERPVIPTCQTLPPGITEQLNNNEKEGEGTTTPPAPSTTPPVISGISVSGITSSSATVGWTTDESATSDVDYGTTTSYGSTTNAGTILSTSHSLVLSGLAASMLYHFRITSADASGNVATSSDETFTTLAAPDVTPPVISAVSVGSIASTSASVAWTTNEQATSKVYFSTSTPLNLSTAMTVTGSGLSTAHSLTLSPLTASTTYNYVIESQDASSNTATTSQASFTTLSL